MIGWTLRIALLLVSALGCAIAMLPLQVVLSQVGDRLPGLKWTQVQGTVWSGRISNFGYGAQTLGDVTVKLRPLSLLSGQLGYDLQVNGPAVRGAGNLSIGSQVVHVSVPQATSNVSELVGLNDTVRRAGGIVRLTNLEVALEREGCRLARGLVYTDTLVFLGNRYQQAFPELSGALTCSQSMLHLTLDGASEGGIAVSIEGTAGLVAPSRLRAVVEGATGETAMALGALGFARETGQYVYVREAVLTGGMP